jgi:CBS domain-containing protein
MAIMTQKHIRHLPVLENGALVGIISVGDMVKQLSHDQQVHIQYLTDFIADRYPG